MKTDSFRQQVYEIVSRIPKGKVATYGQIARLALRPHAARAVGLFMRENTDPSKVPCHRVIGRDGSLTGYGFGGVLAKKRILLQEGVLFREGRVDLERCAWDESSLPYFVDTL